MSGSGEVAALVPFSIHVFKLHKPIKIGVIENYYKSMFRAVVRLLQTE
jgi:hypothetical protein